MRELQHYSIGEVASLLGVTPHAIRAWERRYRILSPERGLNRHRRYSAEDIEFLRDVKRTADINGTSLRLAKEIVNGSLEMSAAAGPSLRPSLVESPPADKATPSDAWRAVGDALPNLIMLLDAEGVVVETNVAVARLLGIVRQRIAGRKFVGLVDPFDRAKASMLYRPQFRAVASWELNLLTREGARLFSFTSWPVVVGDSTFLAVIGTEMFMQESWTGLQTRLAAERVPGVSETGSSHALNTLFDTLPVGVAVATVGWEPRIVYANLSLNLLLRLPPGSLLGSRVSDVLGPEVMKGGLITTTGGRMRRTATRKVIANAKHELRTVIVRPMLSANDTVTSSLIVVLTDSLPAAPGLKNPPVM